jgi:hypothetical protein
LTNSDFSSKELEIIQNQDFLRTKKTVISKIQQLLGITQKKLARNLVQSQLSDGLISSFSPMKISRGENYRDLPYLVLDYPATFSKEDIFAFRTMFWWGNFFSCTLHLQGKPLEQYRFDILEKIDWLVKNEYFVCIGETPWEYHYSSDNYKFLSRNDIDAIEKCRFLKLSKKIELDKWEVLPEFSTSCLSHFLKILTTK